MKFKNTLNNLLQKYIKQINSYEEDQKGDPKLNYSLVWKLFSLERRFDGLVYSKNRIQELVESYPITVPKNYPIEKRFDEVEYYLDFFLLISRTILEIFSALVLTVCKNQVIGSFRFGKLLKTMRRLDDKETSLLSDQLEKLIESNDIEIVKEFIPDGGHSRRDIIAHFHYLNYGKTKMWINGEGAKCVCSPMEDGEDMWEYTNRILVAFEKLFNDILPMVFDKYSKSDLNGYIRTEDDIRLAEIQQRKYLDHICTFAMSGKRIK